MAKKSTDQKQADIQHKISERNADRDKQRKAIQDKMDADRKKRDERVKFAKELALSNKHKDEKEV